jgi:hypothetical protein
MIFLTTFEELFVRATVVKNFSYLYLKLGFWWNGERISPFKDFPPFTSGEFEVSITL